MTKQHYTSNDLHIAMQALLFAFPAGPELCVSLWSSTAAAAAASCRRHLACVKLKKAASFFPSQQYHHPAAATLLDWTKWARSTQQHQITLLISIAKKNSLGVRAC